MKTLSNIVPNRCRQLNLALIFGCGFQRHVLGDTADSAVLPLYDWQYLVGIVAARLQLVIPDKVMSLTQRWAKSVLRVAKEGFRCNARDRYTPFLCRKHVIEEEARRCVAVMLNGTEASCPLYSRVQISLRNCWGAVILLNFDAGWLPMPCRVIEILFEFSIPTGEKAVIKQGSLPLIEANYPIFDDTNSRAAIDRSLQIPTIQMFTDLLAHWRREIAKG